MFSLGSPEVPLGFQGAPHVILGFSSGFPHGSRAGSPQDLLSFSSGSSQVLLRFFSGSTQVLLRFFL